MTTMEEQLCSFCQFLTPKNHWEETSFLNLLISRNVFKKGGFSSISCLKNLWQNVALFQPILQLLCLRKLWHVSSVIVFLTSYHYVPYLVSVYSDFLWPLSNPCPTSVQLLSDSGLQQQSWKYRTYLLIVQVGAAHKLNPSPTHHPFLIIR